MAIYFNRVWQSDLIKYEKGPFSNCTRKKENFNILNFNPGTWFYNFNLIYNLVISLGNLWNCTCKDSQAHFIVANHSKDIKIAYEIVQGYAKT